jgi:hypothetical protein
VGTVSVMATDAEAVTEAIRGATLCALCIARKSGVAPLGVLSALAQIAAQRVKITDVVMRCDDCTRSKWTHRLA